MKTPTATAIAIAILCGGASAQEYISQAKSDIAVLSSSAMSGRGYTLDGIKKAASYIEERFKKIGLQPAGEAYQQPFELKVNTFDRSPTLTVNGVTLQLGQDYLPWATSGSGSTHNETEVIFVRSGLYIERKGINEFSAVRRKGSILIMDEEVPARYRNDTTIDRQLLSKEIRVKIAQLLQPSAILVLVKKPSFGSPQSQERIPVIEVVRERIPPRVEEISLDVRATFDDQESVNIVGLLPGKRTSDSCIVFCAHFDHLGAFTDSSYFPGANDNASGTAMLLGLAEYFRAHPVNATLVFLATSGEEEGLLGSRYYVEHPLHDLGRTRFVLNYDVVGSGDGGIVVVGGENYPEEFGVMKALCDSLKIAPLVKRLNVANSDQYSFVEKGVKAFFLYTLNGKQPYHRFDDIDATLDWGAYGNVFRLSTALIEQIDARGMVLNK